MSSTDYGPAGSGTGARPEGARIPRARSEPSAAPEPTGWVGWIMFAASTMLMLGIFKMIWGLAALFRRDLYAVGPNGLVLNVDYTAWGWTMLLLGAVLAVTGGVLFSGATWARVVGVVLAGLSAIANLLVLGASPVWSTIMIALDVLVIYALTVHGREMKTVRDTEF